MALITDPNSSILNIKKKIEDLESKFSSSGKYLGSFASLDEALESGIAAQATKNDYIFVVRENTRTNFIFNGENWLPGFTVSIDYLDPSDFCLTLATNTGTIPEADFNKLKSNLKASKIYIEGLKTFFHLSTEDNNSYFFTNYQFINGKHQSLQTLTVNKTSGAFSTSTAHINIPDAYDDADLWSEVGVIKQVVKANFVGNSGTLTPDQLEMLKNSAEYDQDETDEIIKAPIYVKLWCTQTGNIYSMVNKPNDVLFVSTWSFTSVLTASDGLGNNVVTVSTISIDPSGNWTKKTKSI